MKKRALISVSDKTGIVEFAAGLSDLGWEIVSTGGTAEALKKAGIAVIGISEVTGFPEILEGRVKTLHPSVHGGILAKNTEEHYAVLREHEIVPIDLVAVNLYPFGETVNRPGVTIEDAVENIDIGGPTMVRSAAKNYERTAVVVNRERYPDILAELRDNGEITLGTKKALALEAFRHTAFYDASISSYLTEAFGGDSMPSELSFGGRKIMDLRYGENPHQKAAFYSFGRNSGGTVAGAQQLHGKELSYNNIVDVEAAWECVREYGDIAVSVIKHTNPCGLALGEDQAEVYLKAFAADPVSAFGSIIGLNREVTARTAGEISKTFVEAVVAPSFSEDALEILKGKKNIRLIAMGTGRKTGELWIEKVSGGFLVQEADSGESISDSWETVTEIKPDAETMKELEFAWKAVRNVKSNAIVVAKDFVTVGTGAGQMNRVGAAEIAFAQAGEKTQGAVLASDAFFPFRDTIDAAAKAGIKAVIQPGGSIRDAESIEACNEHGIAMIFTGKRHFRH